MVIMWVTTGADVEAANMTYRWVHCGPGNLRHGITGHCRPTNLIIPLWRGGTEEAIHVIMVGSGCGQEVAEHYASIISDRKCT